MDALGSKSWTTKELNSAHGNPIEDWLKTVLEGIPEEEKEAHPKGIYIWTVEDGGSFTVNWKWGE